MIWVYKGIDLITTISQVLIIFVIGQTLCRESRTSYSKYLPPVISLLAALFWTWVIVDATYKLPCLLVIMVLLYRLCYQVDVRNALVAALMALIIQGIVENITLLIADLFHFSQTMMIDGVPVASLSVYLLCLFLTLLSSLALYLLFRHFHYQMTNRDFVVVLLFEVTTFILFQMGTLSRINNAATGAYNDKIDTLMIAVGISLTIVFLYIKNNYYLREQEQRSKMQVALLEQQYRYYQDKLQDAEKVRSIYHDMKNHLLVLEGSQGTDAAHKMAEQLRLQIADYENYVHTGNDFLDIIIRDKARIAQEKQIDLSVVIHFSAGSFIEPLDISTIFGNALDNAIEASEKLPAEQRLITVKAADIRDMLVITIENNAADMLTKDKRTTKTDSFLHGFGLSNIKKAAAKYDGQCTIKADDGTFILKIMIPIP